MLITVTINGLLTGDSAAAPIQVRRHNYQLAFARIQNGP